MYTYFPLSLNIQRHWFKSMKKLFQIVIFLFLCLGQMSLYSQELRKFTYGGNGKKSNGAVYVEYFIESGGRKHKINNNTNEIALNNYKEEVRFIIQVSKLKVGLNRSFTKVRNRDHEKVFYLELIGLKVNTEEYKAVGSDTVKIASAQGHYAKKTNRLTYILRPKTSKRKLLFQAKARIIDGIYDRKWDGPIISRSITIVPRIEQKRNKNAVAHSSRAKRKRRSKYNRRKSSKIKYFEDEKDSLQTVITIEDKLWAKIEQDLISGNTDSALERCKIYRVNCFQQIFTSCKHNEEVLFYVAKLIGGNEKTAMVNQYRELYPGGKYIDELEKMITKPPPEVVPIKEGIATLDFDEKVLVVNRIEGGVRPYYMGFFDYQKNKEYAVKRVRFNKKDQFVELQSLEIPEGTYLVKVMDSQGQVFIEKNKIFVSKVFIFPNSIKACIILTFLAVLGFLYKKYIQF